MTTLNRSETLNPWVTAHAAWYQSLPADRRAKYEAMGVAARARFARCRNPHDDTYRQLSRAADVEYSNLCSDFPGTP